MPFLETPESKLSVEIRKRISATHGRNTSILRVSMYDGIAEACNCCGKKRTEWTLAKRSKTLHYCSLACLKSELRELPKEPELTGWTEQDYSHFRSLLSEFGGEANYTSIN